MNKIYMKTYKIALIVLEICTIYCFVISVFGKKAVYDYKSYILVIGILVYIGIVCLFYYKCRNFSNKMLKYFIIVLLSMYLILTLVFGLRIKSERPTDIFNLHNAAISYLRTGEIQDIDYFAHYPYQLNYTYLLIFVYKIGCFFGITDYRTSGTIFGTILLFFSAVLTYKVANKVKDKYLGVCALFVFVTNPIFWIYSSYYYTDLIGMLLFLLIINISLYVYANKNQNINILLCLLLGFIILIGYKFRATVAIAGIAILVLSIGIFGKINKKMYISYFIAVGLGCLIALVWKRSIDSYFGIELDQDKQFPIVHWVMMGLSEERKGRWSGSLWGYTNSFATYEEKFGANVEAIKKSLLDMGVLGLIRLIFDKLAMMWSDGMTALTINFETSVHYGTLYEYTIGNSRAVTCYYTQIIRSSMLICTIPYLFYEMKNKLGKKSVLAVTFLGFMVFYFFWEVHEKYVLMFLPILIIMATYGIGKMVELFEKWQTLILKFTSGEYIICKIKFYEILKKIYLVVCIITILLYICCWNNVVIKTDRKYNKVVYQSNSSDSISIGHAAIRQTFLTKQDFNSIYIKFLNDNVPKEQQYSFALYNDSNDCIYKEDFIANDINNDTYHVFDFDDIHVKGYHEFYFEIVAYDEYKETLKIRNAGNDYSDYYARGSCLVSDEFKGDLTFRVYYVETVGYYSKSFYIIMAFIVILMEIAVYKSIK